MPDPIILGDVVSSLSAVLKDGAPLQSPVEVIIDRGAGRHESFLLDGFRTYRDMENRRVVLKVRKEIERR